MLRCGRERLLLQNLSFHVRVSQKYHTAGRGAFLPWAPQPLHLLEGPAMLRPLQNSQLLSHPINGRFQGGDTPPHTSKTLRPPGHVPVPRGSRGTRYRNDHSLDARSFIQDQVDGISPHSVAGGTGPHFQVSCTHTLSSPDGLAQEGCTRVSRSASAWGPC